MKFDVAGKLYTDLELHEFALDTLDRVEAAEARAAELAAQVEQLTAERDGMRRELQTLVDDIVNFPGHFDRGSESVDAAIEYLAVH